MFGSYIKPHFFMLESGSITMFAAFNQHFVWLSQVWLSLVKSQFYCVSVACFVSFFVHFTSTSHADAGAQPREELLLSWTSKSFVILLERSREAVGS